MKRLLLIAALTAPGLVAADTTSGEDTFTQELRQIQHTWARANYELQGDKKLDAFKSLLVRAQQFREHYPGRAEPRIWEAIVRGGYAGALGGLSALFRAMPQMEKGRDLLLEAVEINPRALDGSAYTTLGVFYHKVPGGFIGYGNDDKALEYLQKALSIDPDGMGPNYFMGEYWADKNHCDKAVPYLKKVLNAPDLSERPIYSRGRKAEARRKLKECRQVSDGML